MKPEPRQLLSDQELISAAWDFLIVKNHPRCATPLGAVYRDGNLRCVIGSFIPEELHALNFPDEPITVLLDRYPEIRAWFQHLTPQLMLEVEEVHNHPDSTVTTRETKMRAIATRFGLKCPQGALVAISA